MSHSDAFALKNTGLDAFLFAEVGAELNGSQLTILSVLARLGQDPWTEAARWSRMPKPAIIDCLAHNISQMPLCPEALVDARTTAARLILLLPSRIQLPADQQKLTVDISRATQQRLIVAMCAGLAFAAAFAVPRLLAPTDAGTPIVQLTDGHPQPPTN